MFTTIDKALVAIVMGVAFVLAQVFGVNVDEATLEKIEAGIVAATPILVWLVPNKTA